MSEALASAKAAEYLRSDIIEGYYAPGQNLSMSETAKRYGVGRPAMRGVFKMMAGQGLLEQCGDTYFVFRLTMPALWQMYTLNRLVAKESPRCNLSFNPAAITFAIFPKDGDIVHRTERFYEINAEHSGGHSFLAIVQLNNARLHKIRLLKGDLFGDRERELDEIIDSARRLDSTAYSKLVDEYHDVRLKRLPELLHLAQQVLKRPA